MTRPIVAILAAVSTIVFSVDGPMQAAPFTFSATDISDGAATPQNFVNFGGSGVDISVETSGGTFSQGPLTFFGSSLGEGGNREIDSGELIKFTFSAPVEISDLKLRALTPFFGDSDANILVNGTTLFTLTAGAAPAETTNPRTTTGAATNATWDGAGGVASLIRDSFYQGGPPGFETDNLFTINNAGLDLFGFSGITTIEFSTPEGTFGIGSFAFEPAVAVPESTSVALWSLLGLALTALLLVRRWRATHCITSVA